MPKRDGAKPEHPAGPLKSAPDATATDRPGENPISPKARSKSVPSAVGRGKATGQDGSDGREPPRETARPQPPSDNTRAKVAAKGGHNLRSLNSQGAAGTTGKPAPHVARPHLIVDSGRACDTIDPAVAEAGRKELIRQIKERGPAHVCEEGPIEPLRKPPRPHQPGDPSGPAANGPMAGTLSPRVGLVRRAEVYRTGRAVGPLITAPHPRQSCRTHAGPRRI